MNLTDILPKENWIEFEKELFDRYHLNCTVYGEQGVGITGKPNWCNRLCPLIKGNKESLATICAAGNQNFMAQSKTTKKPVIGECDAGFVKIAVPIFIGDKFLGTAGGCGLLPEGGEVESFLVEKTLGLSEEEIVSLSTDIEQITAQQCNEMSDYIESRIASFVEPYTHIPVDSVAI